MVEAYTGRPRFFGALSAKTAIQTLGRLSTKSSIGIIIFTGIIHRASGGQHTLRKEVSLMLRLLVLLIALLRDVKTITITLKK